MNRFRSRSAAVTSALAACGLALVTVLSGCSAGQITQTSVQEPSINGTAAIAGDPTTGIALRNVHLRVDQTSDYVRPGADVELLFVAINESAKDKDRQSPVAAVITVPAAFSLNQNKATSEAAALAGFSPACPLVQEPTAAAGTSPTGTICYGRAPLQRRFPRPTGTPRAAASRYRSPTARPSTSSTWRR